MSEDSRPDVSRLDAARVVLALVWQADRRHTVSVLVLQLLSALTGALFAVWVGTVVNAVGRHNSASVVLAAAAVVVSIVSGSMLGYASTRVTRSLSEATHHVIDRRLLQTVGGTPTLEIHETPEHLAQLELLQDEAWEFGDVIPTLVGIFESLIRLVITLVLLVTLDPILLLLPLFGVPILIFGPKASLVWWTAQQRAAEPARRMSTLFELATSAGPAKEIRLFRLRDEIRGRYDEAAEESRSIQTRFSIEGQLIRCGTRIVFAVGYVGAIAIVLRRVVAGDAPVGDLATAAVLGGQVLSLVAGSSATVVWAMQSLLSASRFVYLDRIATGLLPRNPERGSVAEVPSRLTTGMSLRGLGFCYAGRTEPTLHDVNVLLPAGRTVAIVGDNGAGKSTLVKLLAGLYHPSAGEITVDGVDLAALDPQRWGLRLSAGFQDHARFEFTAGEAVGIGDLDELGDADATRSAVHRAAADDVLTSLPDGMATQLGPTWPKGVDLSGGQWQKIAIARAMMRRSPLLLLLDEPTAALDAESEHRLFEGWTDAARDLRERSGAITVLVSHRFSTVRMADLIVVLADGTVAEVGSHEELVRADGLYAEMFGIQARAYQP